MHEVRDSFRRCFLMALCTGKISYLTYRNGISHVEWYITWDFESRNWEEVRGGGFWQQRSTQSGAETWRVEMRNQTDKDKWQVMEDPLAGKTDTNGHETAQSCLRSWPADKVKPPLTLSNTLSTRFSQKMFKTKNDPPVWLSKPNLFAALNCGANLDFFF